MFHPIILAATVVLQDGETAPAVCDIATRTIDNSGDHLSGVKAVMTRMYGAAKANSYNVPANSAMNMGKLCNGHVTSDNCDAACATTEQFVAYITRAAHKLHEQELADRRARGIPWVEDKEVNIALHVQWC